MARVLIADDTMFMRKILADLLKKLGHEVILEAENGEQAVKGYDNLRPDVVTMDITMPVLDGIGAVKGIKAIDPNAKVIMVSAMGQQNMVTEAILVGAKDFVVKPFDPERVAAALKRVLG